MTTIEDDVCTVSHPFVDDCFGQQMNQQTVDFSSAYSFVTLFDRHQEHTQSSLEATIMYTQFKVKCIHQ